jgi:hypothetical protein
VAAPDSYGEPHVDNYEFSSFVWLNVPPKRLGSNYRRMLEKWRVIRESEDILSVACIN